MSDEFQSVAWSDGELLSEIKLDTMQSNMEHLREHGLRVCHVMSEPAYRLIAHAGGGYGWRVQLAYDATVFFTLTGSGGGGDTLTLNESIASIAESEYALSFIVSGRESGGSYTELLRFKTHWTKIADHDYMSIGFKITSALEFLTLRDVIVLTSFDTIALQAH